MEKLTDHTCCPEYITEWHELIAQQKSVVNEILNNGPSKLNIEGIEEVAVQNLRCEEQALAQAFDFKMRMVPYWKIVLRRLMDGIALHLQLGLCKLFNKEMEKDIVNELMATTNGAIEMMFVESSVFASKHDKLNTSIKLLRESKSVLTQIMGKIP